MKQYWEENGGTRFVFNLLVVIQRSISINAFILVRYLYQTIHQKLECWHQRRPKISEGNKWVITHCAVQF